MDTIPLNQLLLYRDTTEISISDTIKNLSDYLQQNIMYYSSADSPSLTSDSALGTFFTDHLLRPSLPLHDKLLPQSLHSYHLALLVIIFIYLIVKMLNPGFFYFSKRAKRFSQGKERTSEEFLSDLLLMINATIIYSSLISLVLSNQLLPSTVNLRENLLLILLFTIILGFTLFKIFFYRFLGVLFRIRQFSGMLIREEKNFFRLSGGLLFPILLLSAFSPHSMAINLLIVAALIAGGLYLRKIILWTRAAIANVHYFGIYFFLYLCTIEILPLFILAKLLVI